MMQPPSFEDNSCPTHVFHLQKALYDLKQAPRAWFHKLNSFLLQLGFQCSRTNASLFYFHFASDIIILLIYVDDILITGSNPPQVHHIISQLRSEVGRVHQLPLCSSWALGECTIRLGGVTGGEIVGRSEGWSRPSTPLVFTVGAWVNAL
ncbi:Retrovirus-related Pol polyprotein from transposon RE1 [Vitis vinifera]|uniref:Retrovirus-related Pol polyprotein from transposon RE1 n=1 Tax=Vitis vinifera TaxID=29760 RepID=A0A438JR37_VITVI|nr:Retrovirus-related Pol polyprotein from transposon RE1 [Vitis vinifera]